MQIEDIVRMLGALWPCADPKLMLLNAPTGTGKSYVTINALCQFTVKHAEFRAFFVTDQKKNLNVKTFEVAWAAAHPGQEVSFVQRVGVLRSLVDTVQQVVQARSDRTLPKVFWIPEVQAAIDEASARLSYFEVTKSQGVSTKTAWQSLNEADYRVRQALASSLAVHANLPDPIDTASQQRFRDYLATHETPACAWLNATYPTIDLARRQILIMTTAKFISSYTPFFQKSTEQFRYSPLLDKAVVVLDEFDSTKQQLWQKAIEDALQVSVDLTTLFNAVYQGLQRVDQLPSSLNALLTRRDSYLVLKKRVAELREQFSLDRLYRSDTSDADTGFVIHTAQRNLISEGKPWHAHQNDKAHNVQLGTAVPDDRHFRQMLFSVSAYLRRFTGFVLARAREYQSQHNQGLPTQSEGLTVRDACLTIYDALGLTRTQAEVLLSLGLDTNVWRRHRGSKVVHRYRRFQTRGLSLFHFINDAQHDLRTDINASFFAVTPERYLLSILNKASVLGLSATATIPTVLDNYDLTLLKEVLGARYVDGGLYLSQETKTALRLDKRYQQAGVAIQPVMATLEMSFAALLKTRCNDRFACLNQQLIQQLDATLEQQLNLVQAQGGDQAYHRQQYLMLFDSFIQFLLDAKLTTFLGLQSRLPSTNVAMAQRYLQETFKLLETLLVPEEEPAPILKMIMPSSTRTIAVQLEEALQLPNQQATRVYLLSAYQTLGVGQNLQHPLSAMEKSMTRSIAPETVDTSDPRLRSADLAGMYLGDVTHILSSQREFHMDAEGLRTITELEYLLDNNEIGYHTLTEQFQALQNGRCRKHPENLLSIAASYSRTIIQAVGRMDRTFNKVERPLLIATPQVVAHIHTMGIDMATVSPEYQALITVLKQEQVSDITPPSANENQNLTRYTHLDIRSLVGHLQNSLDKASYYQAVRFFILAHPTVSDKALAQFINTQGRDDHSCLQYLPNPARAIRYNVHRGRYDDGEYDFTNDGLSISAETANMPAICAFPGLQAELAANHYPTTWQPQANILNPVQFVNLYMGALGEFAGAFIMKKTWPTVQLEKATQASNNELFDFYTVSGVAIDIKNWRGLPNVDAHQERERVTRKLAKLEAATGRRWRVLLINIVAVNDRQPVAIAGDQIVEVPGLIDANGKLILTKSSRLMIGAMLLGK